MRRGRYIILEGPEGCGKTTQCGLLINKLSKENEVVMIREPGGTYVGEHIRELLLDSKNEDIGALTELFLFSASRRHLIERLISPALKEGKIVLSDRSFYSTEAYQGAGGKVDVDVIRYTNRVVTSGATPDLVIILDIDTEIGLRRARGESRIKDRFESKDLDYHKRVRDYYRKIAERDSDVCKLVNATGRESEEIHEEIYQIAKSCIDDI